MQQYMSTYKVTLETKGPLYIGSGKQLGKKEYIHNRQKKEIVVPNLIKMYQRQMKMYQKQMKMMQKLQGQR